MQLRRLPDHDGRASAIGPLQRDDGVGAGRDRRAGHDPRAEARLDADAGVAAGGDVADDRQGHRSFGVADATSASRTA